MLDRLTAQDFAGLSGPMPLESPTGSIEVQVVEVRRFPPHSLRSGEPFAVTLEGPLPVLSQGIYAIEHPVLGRIELFMVPISATPAVARYEVIFN